MQNGTKLDLNFELFITWIVKIYQHSIEITVTIWFLISVWKLNILILFRYFQEKEAKHNVYAHFEHVLHEYIYMLCICIWKYGVNLQGCDVKSLNLKLTSRIRDCMYDFCRKTECSNGAHSILALVVCKFKNEWKVAWFTQA